MWLFLLKALVWDDALTGPFSLIAEYSLLKVGTCNCWLVDAD